MSDVARAIGVPLKIDQATINGDFGHFSRVLIDIDLKSPLLNTIQLEWGEECRFINPFYENFPDFCSTCSSIGHFAAHCFYNAPKGDMNDNSNKKKSVEMNDDEGKDGQTQQK